MPDIDPELLQKYFDGQCTPEEESRVMGWLHSNRDDSLDESIFEGIDKTLLKNSIWEEVQPAPNVKRSRQGWLSFVKLAASVLIIMVLVHLIYKSQFVHPVDESMTTEARQKTIKTALGEKREVTLQDGTIIYLNSGSELQVPVPFSDTARTVHLNGEAYLQVAHDSTRPFSVVTQYTTVKVLGTIFNVNAYRDDEYTTVVVAQGKVRMSAKNADPIILTRDQLGSYSSTTGIMSEKNVYAAAYIGWKENELIFQNKPLKEIVKVLERWYAIQVEITNPALGEHRFTGKYKDVRLPSLVKDMGQVMQFQYKLDQNKLTIY